ncbi:MAG TPA: prepilin-type N-terminal cleavage/methylation domain-containing protein [Candidatus Saccharimonadales bacterium]
MRVAKNFFNNKTQQGFTIVELLIVIVVIAILAAITIVAYNGIQNRAADSAVKTDLRNVATKLATFNVDNGRYPTAAQLDSIDFKLSNSSYAISPATVMNFTYCYDHISTPTSYTVLAMSKSGNIFYIGSSSPIATYPASWTGNTGTNCTNISAGLTLNYNGYLSTDTTTGPWRAWTE